MFMLASAVARRVMRLGILFGELCGTAGQSCCLMRSIFGFHGRIARYALETERCAIVEAQMLRVAA